MATDGIDQLAMARQIVQLAGEDYSLGDDADDKLDALQLLDYMGMLGIEFARGTDASAAYYEAVTRRT